MRKTGAGLIATCAIFAGILFVTKVEGQRFGLPPGGAIIGSPLPVSVGALAPVRHRGVSVVNAIGGNGSLFAEPSIATDRLNPAIIVVGTGDYVSGIVRWYTSTVGGAFFFQSGASNELSDYLEHADVVVRADAYTTFYSVWTAFDAVCGSQRNAIVLTKSTDGGITWAQSTVVDGSSGSIFHDKPWLAVNRWTGTPTVGQLWVIWNRFNATCSPDLGQEQIQTSTNGGAYWPPPVTVFQSGIDQQETWPGEVVVVSDGTALASYMGEPIPGAYMVRFVSCSTSNPPSCRAIASLPAVSIPVSNNLLPNFPALVNSFPRLAVNDLSGGNAAVLVTWLDLRNGLGQIRTAVSMTGGRSFQNIGWADASASADQCEPEPSWEVDSDGTSHPVVCYYQRQSETNHVVTYVCTRSNDNGLTWLPRTPMPGTPFTATGYMGDYQDFDGTARASAYTIAELLGGGAANFIDVASYP